MDFRLDLALPKLPRATCKSALGLERLVDLQASH